MFTDWASVPLVCDRATTAKVLGISTRAIDRELASGRMVPAPMPRRGKKWLWSKAVLQQYVDGGYQRFQMTRRRA
jgi:hypothetical protein